jgi:hypothetical protein
MTQRSAIKPCETCSQRQSGLYGERPPDLPHLLDELDPVEIVTKPTMEQTRYTCKICGTRWTTETPTDPDKQGTHLYGWWE